MAYVTFSERRPSLVGSPSTLFPEVIYSDGWGVNNSSGLKRTDESGTEFTAIVSDTMYPNTSVTKSCSTQTTAPRGRPRSVIPAGDFCHSSHVEASPLRLHTVVLRHGRFDAFYQSEFFYTTGGNTPYSYSAVGLPAGLFLDRGGKLSGIARECGMFHIVVRVVDSIGNAISRSYQLRIEAPTDNDNDVQLLPTARLGAHYCSPLVLSSKDSLPPMLIVQGLPKGLHVSENNIIGVPTELGNFRVTQTIHSPSAGSDCVSYNLTVEY
ncbi:putative Ig domain-containing protein [Brucella pituitosa]|uniref:putative Ig domain-containing protein n=1 Tax=Brucella pituitosa TaxID=571256 RepID=UPI0012FE1509|nr:putative Ig domain-containing protein [Brucella pituitosa]